MSAQQDKDTRGWKKPLQGVWKQHYSIVIRSEQMASLSSQSSTWKSLSGSGRFWSRPTAVAAAASFLTTTFFCLSRPTRRLQLLANQLWPCGAALLRRSLTPFWSFRSTAAARVPAVPKHSSHHTTCIQNLCRCLHPRAETSTETTSWRRNKKDSEVTWRENRKEATNACHLNC